MKKQEVLSKSTQTPSFAHSKMLNFTSKEPRAPYTSSSESSSDEENEVTMLTPEQQQIQKNCQYIVFERLMNSPNICFYLDKQKPLDILIQYANDEDVSLEKFACCAMSVYSAFSLKTFTMLSLIETAKNKPELLTLDSTSVKPSSKQEMKDNFLNLRKEIQEVCNGTKVPSLKTSKRLIPISNNYYFSHILSLALHNISNQVQKDEELDCVTSNDILLFFSDIEF
ncbi:hypothetical protein AB837_00431 [bacterium AB1]|nr:hypothetical protein AB837_00431 [bacterium AB1]